MKEAHDHYATLPYKNILGKKTLLYGRTAQTRTGIDRLKAGYSTFELRSLIFCKRLRALLLLRCEPAFRLLASTANILRGFILFSFKLKMVRLRGIEPLFTD